MKTIVIFAMLFLSVTANADDGGPVGAVLGAVASAMDVSGGDDD